MKSITFPAVVYHSIFCEKKQNNIYLTAIWDINTESYPASENVNVFESTEPTAVSV